MKEIVKTHFFWKYTLNKNGLFSKTCYELYENIITILKFTHVFCLGLLFVHFFADAHVVEVKMIEPLWPMKVFIGFDSGVILYMLHLGLFVIFSLLCFKPLSSILRAIAFIGYFFLLAFNNSFGKINHGHYLVLMILFCFALFPTTKKENYKEKTILIFATAQFFLLFSYSLTGAWKLLWGIIEFFTKEVSLFSSLSFRNILIAQYQFVEPNIIGKWLLQHYIIGWFLYLLVVYVEVFSIVIFFRSNLHKVWGLLLLSLHVGTHFVLNVNMSAAPFYIGLLLLMSSFYRETTFRQTILSLPIVSLIVYLRKK